MNSLHTRVPTEHASRYLQQLCKHWSHRFKVEFDPHEGTIHLPGADCLLEARSDALMVTLETSEDTDLHRLGSVVDDHLRRFAFREELEIRWAGADALVSMS